MQANQLICNQCREKRKPVMINEVGNLIRGNTWRISLDDNQSFGIFGNNENFN
jgi:hypothetical protein